MIPQATNQGSEEGPSLIREARRYKVEMYKPLIALRR